ncbi:hypothetical protein A2W14_01960 [Candidatus Gottesmanbacteria bacterium RBG_16_37_8]|uniref:Glycosyltransferase 2-like domain-containing protein n=1 Tax=Candidatus Gottesmanbacteria bacterium RBG_16_37_8 TaxID=1798371 RepID=A0A1F5YWF3_9BACT|nr:MAG: hypothetical protein A2W14_01960 [Candidatus Gottesmanbacteria bacterium RBG_16_37_8]
MKKSYIIIVHYGDPQVTLSCLKSLSGVGNKIPVIVLNNNSAPLSDAITSLPQVTVVNCTENLGFAKANNEGIKIALKRQAENIILLNNDTLVSPDLISELISFAENNGQIGLVSPKIYFAEGHEFHKKRYRPKDLGKVIWYAGGLIDWKNIYAAHVGVDEVDHGQFDKVSSTDFATGCCMLIKRKVLEKIGLFDENYFLYFEDVDYSQRAIQAGFQVFFNPQVFLWHKNAAASFGPGSVLHQYYQTRNRLYFGFKYASLRTKSALIKESFKHLLTDKLKRKAVLGYYFHQMGKGKP